MSVTILTTASFGSLALSDGVVYPLTPCCQASAKGSMAGGEPATVCRVCYREIDPLLGDCAVVSSPTFSRDLRSVCATVGADRVEVLKRILQVKP